MSELRDRLLDALNANSYRGQWSSDHGTMLPMRWDADDAVDRIIEDAALGATPEALGLDVERLTRAIETAWDSPIHPPIRSVPADHSKADGEIRRRPRVRRRRACAGRGGAMSALLSERYAQRRGGGRMHLVSEFGGGRVAAIARCALSRTEP